MKVENIGSSTLIWKKDNRIISAGEIVIRKDKRFILSGSNLTMHSVQVKDEGDYVCEVETYNEPIRQISQLIVLVPAQVEPIPQVGILLHTTDSNQYSPLGWSVHSQGRVYHHPAVQS